LKFISIFWVNFWMMLARVPNILFYMWISNYASSICLKRPFFLPLSCLAHLYQQFSYQKCKGWDGFFKCLFLVYWDRVFLLVFYSNNMVHYINWYSHVKQTLHSWNKSHLSCFFMCVWVWFASVLLEIFSSVLIKGHWSIVFFICDSFVWFSYQGNPGVTERVENSSFWNFLEISWVNFSICFINIQ
jgi:hypothetical protein